MEKFMTKEFAPGLALDTGEFIPASDLNAQTAAPQKIGTEALRTLKSATAQPAPAAVTGLSKAITASIMRDDGGDHPAFCLMAAYRSQADAEAALEMLAAAPTTQQEAQEPVAWLEYARKKPSLRRLSFTKTADKELRISGWVAEPLSIPKPAEHGDAQESEYRRGYRHGYEQRDAEVRGALV